MTTVVSSVVDGNQVWGEWEFAGTRTDGEPFLMRGVVILTAQDDRAVRGRFYLEPVEVDDIDATAAVGRLIGSLGSAGPGAMS